VWCTQYRAPVITDEIERRLSEIITEVAEEKGARLLTLDISPVHVHGVVEVSPRFGIHRLVKAMKSRSAGVLRTEFPSLRSRLPSLWTNSYLVTTVGAGAPGSMIQHYVDNQKTR
jgi:putative transposase